jgi:hypothetical protein
MEPDNALYDATCDLLSAARRMDRAVQRDGVARSRRRSVRGA